MKKTLSKSYYLRETDKYLAKFSKKHPLNYILDSIENMASLKVLVVGEAIIDNYQFGSVLGKSAKEPILALRSTRSESYLGGSLAVANHLANFCKEVGLLAMLGEKDSHESFIRKGLKKNIKPTFVYKKSSPTIVKKRFLEDDTFRKIFELYTIDNDDFSKDETKRLLKKLKPLLNKYDLVICTDFGHGMLTEESRNFLIRKAKFLSVNTQANAGNFGYHTISDYPKADLVCLDEREIRLECRSKNGDFEGLAKSILDRIKTNYMVVTRGSGGSIGWENKNRRTVHKVPSLSTKDIDRVGAGDAFFAIVSALIYGGTPLDVACFIGNMVGGLAIGVIGNKKSITKKDLMSFIKEVLE